MPGTVHVPVTSTAPAPHFRSDSVAPGPLSPLRPAVRRCVDCFGLKPFASFCGFCRQINHRQRLHITTAEQAACIGSMSACVSCNRALAILGIPRLDIGSSVQWLVGNSAVSAQVATGSYASPALQRQVGHVPQSSLRAFPVTESEVRVAPPLPDSTISSHGEPATRHALSPTGPPVRRLPPAPVVPRCTRCIIKKPFSEFCHRCVRVSNLARKHVSGQCTFNGSDPSSCSDCYALFVGFERPPAYSDRRVI